MLHVHHGCVGMVHLTEEPEQHMNHTMQPSKLLRKSSPYHKWLIVVASMACIDSIHVHLSHGMSHSNRKPHKTKGSCHFATPCGRSTLPKAKIKTPCSPPNCHPKLIATLFICLQLGFQVDSCIICWKLHPKMHNKSESPSKNPCWTGFAWPS